MSFNLGNWWERLNLDILKDWQNGNDGDNDPDVPPDLDLPDDYHDPSWDDQDPYGLTDPPSPDPEQGGPLDDLEVPSIPVPDGGDARPGYQDGPRIDFTWPF